MISLAPPSRTNREDSIIPVSPKKTSRLQSLLSSIAPRSPKRSADSSFPTIITLESPKSTSAFRKELKNAARKLNQDSFVQFSKEQMDNFIIQFATRQIESITEKANIIKAFSTTFNVESEPMRRKFIIPKANSQPNLLQAFTSALSKKKQPKNKLLNEFLILIIKLLEQPLAKSVESSIMVSMSDLEEKNKREQESLGPLRLGSLLKIPRQKQQKSLGEKIIVKKRIVDSFGLSAKPMDLKLIDLNQSPKRVTCRSYDKAQMSEPVIVIQLQSHFIF